MHNIIWRCLYIDSFLLVGCERRFIHLLFRRLGFICVYRDKEHGGRQVSHGDTSLKRLVRGFWVDDRVGTGWSWMDG